MPVRIYSLAKELKLDSKILVDICTSAGVTGKGSALASLTDEEVDRVKAYMGGAGATAKAPAPKPRAAVTTSVEAPAEGAVVRREDYIAPAAAAGDKMPVLDDRSKKKKSSNGETAPRPAPAKPGATIKLAPLPTASQPTAAPPRQRPLRRNPTCDCRSMPSKLPAAAAAPSR